MENEVGGPPLNLLLLVGGKSSRMGTRKELLRFPDGRLALEHALDTLHGAVPSASTIFISLHDGTQLEDIQTRLEGGVPQTVAADNVDHSHKEHAFPKLHPIFDSQEVDIGPAAGLLAAHSICPEANWLVLGCDYPLLSPFALQQLIREYRPPATCFVNENGFAEPLIAIWAPIALEILKDNVRGGRYGLSSVFKEVKGSLVKPFLEEWVTGTNTGAEWDEAMALIISRAT